MSRRAEVITLVAVALLLGRAWIATDNRDVLWKVDSASRFIQLRAFQRTGDVAIDVPALRGIHFVRVNGRNYSIYSPLFAILTAPLFSLFGYPGLLLPAVAGTIALICLLPAFAKHSVLLTGVVILFATPLFWYTLV